jgi:hypothetical protein
VFVEAILDEEQTATGEQALPMYLQMIDRELSSGVLAGAEDDRAGGALLCDVEALPLHLALTPPQMLGQVEVLSPVEKYDDVTQMADFDRLRWLHPTSTRCTESETCYSCGIAIADFCEGADDENLG